MRNWLVKHVIEHRRPVACAACAVAVALNATHPLFHGTPLDGGALDGLIAYANVWAAALAQE